MNPEGSGGVGHQSRPSGPAESGGMAAGWRQRSRGADFNNGMQSPWRWGTLNISPRLRFAVNQPSNVVLCSNLSFHLDELLENKMINCGYAAKHASKLTLRVASSVLNHHG